jgi:hypothetical protein
LPDTHEIFQQRLQDKLRSYQALFVKGLSEYEIINLLKEPPDAIFSADALSDSLVLFQTHFILFHTLYKLRNEWRSSKVGELSIVTTNIKLTLFDAEKSHSHKKEESIENVEPLAEYYLNWKNFSNTHKKDVESLLNDFWNSMAQDYPNSHYSTKEIKEAMVELELGSTPVEDLCTGSIKTQYHRLQHQFHPDKGGSHEKAQRIAHAYKVLCQSAKKKP